MNEIAESIKSIGGVCSAILVCSSFVVTAIKPVRNWLKGKVRDIAKSDETDKMVKETNALLKKHIEDDAAWKQTAEDSLIKQRDADIVQLRIAIKSIYDKGRFEKKISDQDLQDLIDMFDLYRSMNGNHYTEKIYNEMMLWKVVPEFDTEPLRVS